MALSVSADRLRVLINQFRDRLWLKPLVVCTFSIAIVFAAHLADDTFLVQIVPVIAPDSIETLLSIMSASMLVIATFSVASMVSAYGSASRTATPRSFTLVVADGASQNALSTFVGAFIFSIVALTAFKNAIFAKAGLFILFVLTVIVFAIVIITFVRWVDRIARLGRLGSTIGKVEKATAEALKRRRNMPTLCGVPISSHQRGQAVLATCVGYVQHIDVAKLHHWAKENQTRVIIAALPGTFTTPGRVLAYVPLSSDCQPIKCKEILKSFQIGSDRLFDDDPRFGLVVLSEIAGRALSPAVNDPGTAIDIVGTLVRLFTQWSEPKTADDESDAEYDRVEVPEISVRDMFDDAFTAIGRDGAGMVEVAVWLQKALHSLRLIGDADMQVAAEYHQQVALKRAQIALDLTEDITAVRNAGRFAVSTESSSPNCKTKNEKPQTRANS